MSEVIKSAISSLVSDFLISSSGSSSIFTSSSKIISSIVSLAGFLKTKPETSVGNSFNPANLSHNFFPTSVSFNPILVFLGASYAFILGVGSSSLTLTSISGIRGV